MAYRGSLHLMSSIGRCVKNLEGTRYMVAFTGQVAVRGGSERYVDKCCLEKGKRQWMIRRKCTKS